VRVAAIPMASDDASRGGRAMAHDPEAHWRLPRPEARRRVGAVVDPSEWQIWPVTYNAYEVGVATAVDPGGMRASTVL
jgi:hypothetical protein